MNYILWYSLFSILTNSVYFFISSPDSIHLLCFVIVALFLRYNIQTADFCNLIFLLWLRHVNFGQITTNKLAIVFCLVLCALLFLLQIKLNRNKIGSTMH